MHSFIFAHLRNDIQLNNNQKNVIELMNAVADIKNVPFSKLVRLEDELKKFNNDVVKLLKEFMRKYKKTKGEENESLDFYKFYTDNLKYFDIEEFLSSSRKVVAEIKKRFLIKTKKYEKESKLMVKQPNYSFIATFYIKIPATELKLFSNSIKKVLNLECVEIAQKNTNLLIFQVFCIKKEKDKIIKELKERFIVLENIHTVDKQQKTDFLAFLRSNAEVLHEIYIKSLFAMGLSDCLQRNGCPLTYVYGIVPIKEIKKINKMFKNSCNVSFIKIIIFL
ncbi:hypothetical protein NUSPORA_00380 [Nucleospora cyclopteri]